jgi:8-amino-7-oxononanoate synthase
MNRFSLPRTIWPVKWGKQNELYFYLESIEEVGNNIVTVSGKGKMIMLSSYSYLGLLGHPKINESANQAIAKYGTGTHGVRLLSGTIPIHNELEEYIAKFKNTEAAIVYSSGYVANVSVISTILRNGDIVLCDKLNHASIVDGCKLSGAQCFRFKHNDINHLEHFLKKGNPKKNKMVIVDAIFSMDGDIAPIPEIVKLCKKYGALLMVDEAHSLGVLGENGKGIDEYFDLEPGSIDLKMGTLSKAIPATGGYVASDSTIIDMLKHNSRGFIYSAALSPPMTAAALTSLKIILQEKERVQKLKYNMFYFRNKLQEKGFNTLNTQSPIVPVVCGENNKAWLLAKLCQDKGLFVQGIPSPVVPDNTSRLRAIVTSAHTIKEIDYCIEVIEKNGREIGVI